MKNIILPGYSLYNKQWAQEVANNLEAGSVSVIHEWGHWLNKSFSLEAEANKIIEEIGEDKVNIIAKSVGTRVVMHLIPKIINKVNKVILCGIPTKFEDRDIQNLYKNGVLRLGASNIICFQNTSDPFAPYQIIKNYFSSIDPKINVIEKPGTDHDYPYFDDFKAFLTSK